MEYLVSQGHCVDERGVIVSTVQGTIKTTLWWYIFIMWGFIYSNFTLNCLVWTKTFELRFTIFIYCHFNVYKAINQIIKSVFMSTPKYPTLIFTTSNSNPTTHLIKCIHENIAGSPLLQTSMNCLATQQKVTQAEVIWAGSRHCERSTMKNLQHIDSSSTVMEGTSPQWRTNIHLTLSN